MAAAELQTGHRTEMKCPSWPKSPIYTKCPKRLNVPIGQMSQRY